MIGERNLKCWPLPDSGSTAAPPFTATFIFFATPLPTMLILKLQLHVFLVLYFQPGYIDVVISMGKFMSKYAHTNWGGWIYVHNTDWSDKISHQAFVWAKIKWPDKQICGHICWCFTTNALSVNTVCKMPCCTDETEIPEAPMYAYSLKQVLFLVVRWIMSDVRT